MAVIHIKQRTITRMQHPGSRNKEKIMNSPFPFDSMLVFAFLSAMLLLGIALRAKVALLQKFLFPSCLTGGVIGLVLVQAGLIPISAGTFETFAYHFFNISFISVGLTRDTDTPGASQKGRWYKGPGWMALMQGLTFPMQAVIGGLLVIILGVAGMELFPTFGFLAPLGFNEGPGQALSLGKAWEALGFSGGATIGVTFAAAGYVFAFFIGVPLVNYGIRKGWAAFGSGTLSKEVITGLVSKSNKTQSAGGLTIHSGNAETLAFQAALVGIVYGITWALVGLIGSFFAADVASMLWGFFFFFGLGVAYLLRILMDKAGIGYLVDPGIQRRVTGWAVDYLIVATVCAIQFAVVMEYLLPISLIALTNGIATTLLVIYMGKRLENYGLERSAAIFGTVTGTVSCGLLLLRIVDPEFKTPVAFEIALMNLLVLPIVGGCSVLVNGPLWWDWSVGFTTLVFAGIFVVCLALLKVFGYIRPKTS
jgi:ESS family glutamate:Na+ symporter